MALSVLLNGSRGRMGRALADAAPRLSAVIGAAVDAGDDAAARLAGCQVIIDFSSPDATGALLDLAIRHAKPIVIGTTGHSAALKQALLEKAARVPCVWAGNFSVGVNLLFALTRRAAQVLGPEYDAEIIEMHHRFKKDAPSGTAARLLEVLKEARSASPNAVRHGREGLVGERPPGEIGMHALRGGDVVGDHTVIFAGLGERLELTHKASDRAVFAQGALRAAHWVVSQKPGVYDMQDVLGLR